MSETTNENAAAAANPEPTTTTVATDAALVEVNEPAQSDSQYDDNKNSDDSEPVQEASVSPAHEEDDDPESNVGDEVEDNG